MNNRTKIGLGSLVYTLVGVGILIFVNLLGVGHPLRIDWSAKGTFSLSSQSLATLGKLMEPISLMAFVKEGERGQVRDMLEKYEYESDKFSFEIIDPDKRPELAKKYDVKTYGTYIVETPDGKRSIAKKLTEEDITNAIIEATTLKQKKIYVLEGHNERSLVSEGPQGWSAIKKIMESSSYLVDRLNWFTVGKIPPDADLLIIPGPRVAFQPGEITRLREWLDKGGALFLALDPGPHDNLRGMMLDWGIKFHDDHIIDPVSEQVGLGPAVATLSTYGTSPIVKDFRAASFFPFARSLSLVPDNPKKAKVEMVGQTSFESWGETDLDSIEQGVPKFSEADDLPGPRIVVAAITWDLGEVSPDDLLIGEKAKVGRMVVSGDSDFAANAGYGLSLNKDMLLNIVGWLTRDDSRLTIRPKTAGFNPIMFTAGQLTTIFWTVVILFPGLFAAVGLMVGYRRRRG